MQSPVTKMKFVRAQCSAHVSSIDLLNDFSLCTHFQCDSTVVLLLSSDNDDLDHNVPSVIDFIVVLLSMIQNKTRSQRI